MTTPRRPKSQLYNGVSAPCSLGPTPTPPSGKVPEQPSRSAQRYRLLLGEALNCGRSLQVRFEHPTSAEAPRPHAGLRKGLLAGPPRVVFAVLPGLGAAHRLCAEEGRCRPHGPAGCPGRWAGAWHSPHPWPPAVFSPLAWDLPTITMNPASGPAPTWLRVSRRTLGQRLGAALSVGTEGSSQSFICLPTGK